MRKVRPKEGSLFSQVQTVYISSELGFLGSRHIFTHHFILCPSSYPIHILLSLFFNNVSQCPEREERMEEVILKPLRSKVPQRETEMFISLWILGGAVDSGPARIPESWDAYIHKLAKFWPSETASSASTDSTNWSPVGWICGCKAHRYWRVTLYGKTEALKVSYVCIHIYQPEQQQ